MKDPVCIVQIGKIKNFNPKIMGHFHEKSANEPEKTPKNERKNPGKTGRIPHFSEGKKNGIMHK